MATVVTAKKRVTKTYNTGSGGSSSGKSSNGSSGSGSSNSSSSSGRVPANSYGTGDKYAGGNTFVRPDGSTYEYYGEHTSPSGKTTYTDDDGNITVTNSSKKSEVGKVYSNEGESLGYAPGYSAGYSGSYGNNAYNMQVDALRQAMGSNKDALEDSFYANKRALRAATLDGQRQAYVNQQKALRNLPQTMAAAGYTGGITESTAANIANEYQNAWNDYERAEAQELARLQADLANGIANVDTKYNVEIANALAAAQALERQQQQYADELAFRQAAAAAEQERYNMDYALQQQKLQLERDRLNQNQPAAVNAPTSLTAANQMAINSQSVAPLAAYYKSLGWSDDAIARELNMYTVDPESAFYGFR